MGQSAWAVMGSLAWMHPSALAWLGCAVVHLPRCSCWQRCLPHQPLPASSSQTLRILTSWYLSKWSGAEVAARMTGGSVDRIHYIGGYIGFALGEQRS